MSKEYYLNAIDSEINLFKQNFLNLTNQIELYPNKRDDLISQFKSDTKIIYNKIIEYRSKVYEITKDKILINDIDNKIKSMNDVLDSIPNMNTISYVREKNKVLQSLYESCSNSCSDIDNVIDKGSKLLSDVISKKNEIKDINNLIEYNEIKLHMMSILLNLINDSIITELKDRKYDITRYDNKKKILDTIRSQM